MTVENTPVPETPNGILDVDIRANLLTRDAPSRDQADALADLHATLAAYSELFARVDVASKRQATWRAIDAMLSYFVSQGLPLEAMIPIMNAGLAAAEAAVGIENRVFAPERSKGRPRQPALTQVGESILAVIAELCVREKRKQGERPYLKPGINLAKKMILEVWGIKVSYSELKEFREKCSEARSESGLIAFKELTGSTMATLHPLEFAKALLKLDRAAMYWQHS